MPIETYSVIIADVKKLIFNLNMIRALTLSLYNLSICTGNGVNKLSYLTLIDHTTKMLVKMFKNFKGKYSHFIQNVKSKYNNIMVLLYIRIQKFTKIDERILKNCVYMLYSDFTKYYIYSEFSDSDMIMAQNDAYMGTLFAKIMEVLNDFVKFLECKMAKYGTVTRIGYVVEGGGNGGNLSSNYYSQNNILEGHIDRYGIQHKKNVKNKMDTSSNDRYIKSSSGKDREGGGESESTKYGSTSAHNRYESKKPSKTPVKEFTSSVSMSSDPKYLSKEIEVEESKVKRDLRNLRDLEELKEFEEKHSKKSKESKESRGSSKELRELSEIDQVFGKIERKHNESSFMPEIKYDSKKDLKKSSKDFIPLDNHHSDDSGDSSMSEFSFMDFERPHDHDARPEIVKEMHFLEEHHNENPHGNDSVSDESCGCDSPQPLDAVEQQEFLIHNNISNPNANRKYRKICDELTCNSSEIKYDVYDSEKKRNKRNKKKYNNLSFDQTSDICDFPSNDPLLICNDSPSSDILKEHHNKKKHDPYSPSFKSISNFESKHLPKTEIKEIDVEIKNKKHGKKEIKIKEIKEVKEKIANPRTHHSKSKLNESVLCVDTCRNKSSSNSSNSSHSHSHSHSNVNSSTEYIKLHREIVDECLKKTETVTCDSKSSWDIGSNKSDSSSKIRSPVDSLMCESSADFTDASDPKDKLCTKYKDYIPKTRKILKEIHTTLKMSKLTEEEKRNIFNTVMRIKNNRRMYHIFKAVSKQSGQNFDEMVKAVCKLALPSN